MIDREVENLIKTVPAMVIEGPRGCGKTMTGLNSHAIEVKLGLNQIEYGAERLSLAVEQIDKNPPAFKAVVTGNGPILQLKDGTFTFPLYALRP